VCATFAIATVVRAAEQSRDSSYYIGGAAEFTDNIGREASNEASGYVMGVIAGFNLARESGRLAGSLEGELAYFDYSDSRYPADVFGTAFGRLNAALVRDRLSWTFEDAYAQTLLSTIQIETPNNRESVE